jgi:hypothetical protein
MRNTANDRALKIAGWFAAFVLPVLISSQASGQSGRRAPRTLPTTNTTEYGPTDKEHKPPVGPELARHVTLLIARQPTSKHFAAEDVIHASFINSLSEFSGLTVKSIGDLKRDQAVKRARAEAEAFVVLMHFDIDSFQEGTIILNSRDLEVKYSVFAPRTGKEQSKGKVYYQGVGGGRLRKSEWPTGTPIRITTEAAGIEAAGQLHAWLVITVGVKHKT